MIPSRDHIVPLLTTEQLQARIKELAVQITADYAGKDLVVVGLLNGVFPFFADLVRAIPLDMDITFMQVASYHGGTESTGEVKIVKDLDRSIQGRHCLVVEDIVDTGTTLHKVCTLLDKPSRRKTKVEVDYIGFPIEDHFVVGFGLDLDGRFRNVPFVGIYQP
jgi:hypoxanthine phosphoribosyltransferase